MVTAVAELEPARDLEAFKVSSTTSPAKLASAIAHCLDEHDDIEIAAIGEKQAYIALKACAIEQRFAELKGFGLGITVEFFVKPNRNRPGRTVTGLMLKVRRVSASMAKV